MNEIKAKAIFNPAIARHLLREGNPIIDIKQNRANKDKTVHYFEMTEKFCADLEKISAEFARKELSAKGVETAVVPE